MVYGAAGRWVRVSAFCFLALTGLAGCNDEGDGAAAAAPSTSQSTTGSSTNAAPTISGTATTSIAAGGSYAFAPVAADANGDVLTFSIDNKPAWATFSTTTGSLTGTPAASDVGTYANITIRVSDGSASRALGAFTINVTQIGSGAVTLSWLPPTEYTDGSPLVDLAGYYIHYGTSSGNLDRVLRIDNASISQYQVDNLSPATWYFAIKSYTAAGVQSSFSGIASKTVS